MNFAPSALPFFSAKKLFSAATVARLSLSLLLGLALPTQASAQDRQETLPLPLNEVRMFTEALERIRMSYVEEVDDQTLLENAIRGMLAGLDPHSSYMAGEDFDLLEEPTTGEFGGLGVEVGRENGYIRVISTIDDSPADRAGIKAGDLIIQIDSKPLREMLPEEVSPSSGSFMSALLIGVLMNIRANKVSTEWRKFLINSDSGIIGAFLCPVFYSAIVSLRLNG